MITIDYALRIYTDTINAGNNVDVGYFKENLTDEDFKEFLELVPFINILKSAKKTTRKEPVGSKIAEIILKYDHS